MNDSTSTSSISIQTLPSRRVASKTCVVNQPVGAPVPAIRECFESVKAWAAENLLDSQTLHIIGIPRVENGTLVDYDCCVELPSTISSVPDDMNIRVVEGGRYAVVSGGKAGDVGAMIGSFYADYVPANGIELDPSRPAYEVYYADTFDYCAPIR